MKLSRAAQEDSLSKGGKAALINTRALPLKGLYNFLPQRQIQAQTPGQQRCSSPSWQDCQNPSCKTIKKQMHHTTVQKRFKNNFTVLRSSLKIRKSSKQSLPGQSEAPKLFYNALQEQKTEVKKPNNLNIVNLGF